MHAELLISEEKNFKNNSSGNFIERLVPKPLFSHFFYLILISLVSSKAIIRILLQGALHFPKPD